MSVDVHSQQQAMDRLDLAKSAYEAGQFDRALSHIRRAVEMDPDNVNARLLQARIYLKQNKPNLAMSALRLHEKLCPQAVDSPEVAMLRAEALSASGFDRIAREQLRRLAEQLPDDVRPYRMLSGIHLKLNEVSEAINSLQQLVRLSPSDRAATRLLSELMQKRDPEQSIELLLAGPMHQQEPGVLLRAARQCRELDRLRDAEELYASLLQLRPDDPGVLIEAGTLADLLGNDELAVKRLEHAIAIKGDHQGAAYLALANAHAHVARFASAVWCCWKAAKRLRHDARPWAGLAVYAKILGRTHLAARALEQVNRYTGSRQRQKMLAEFWQHAAASHAIEQALDGLPDDPPNQTTLQKLLKQAARTLDAVTSDYPQRADAHYHMAVCQHLLGDPTKANIYNDQALAINPNYAAAQALAEQIEEQIHPA